MLSRRIVRVKVMQALYAMNKDSTISLKDLTARYNDSVNKTYELYLFNLLQYIKVTQYALKDAEKRKTKLVPTEEDKKFVPKLVQNPLTTSLLAHKGLAAQFKKYNLGDDSVDEDNARALYTDFARSKEYRAYNLKTECTNEEHLEMLLVLYKHCCDNEHFVDIMESRYYNWIDDESLVVGATKKTLKALPTTDDFYTEFLPDIEATKDFGENLLITVYNHDQELLEVIEPVLQNWGSDRVAVIDLIFIKMALCEMLDFKSIPTKVTLNEFVEISKQYSTERSKEFINGVLDKLMKQLAAEGRIVKEGRGLVE